MSHKARKPIATVIRREEIPDRSTLSQVELADNALFQKYFEQHYAPLEGTANTEHGAEVETVHDDASSEASGWSGFSDTEMPEVVEMVDYTRTTMNEEEGSSQSRDSFKSYMSSRPPSSTIDQLRDHKSRTHQKNEHADDAGEAANVKNDLALQRLLRESHLLESNQSYTPSGAQRHKAVDLRLRSLGSSDSIFSQQRMPLSHRKGIQAKALAIESRRRREAKDNGIILERPAGGTESKFRRRERGVGGPAIGKFTGGTLKLSRKDLQDLRGPPARSGRGKRGKS